MINQVYNRIIWDARLHSGAFTIGYQERLSSEGIREKPLVEWSENGDIPWHRIRYIKCGEVVVWDRDKQIDLFKSDNLPESAWKSQPSVDVIHQPTNIIFPYPNLPGTNNKNAAFHSRYVYNFSGHDWQIIDANLLTNRPIKSTRKNLRIITFNILCGLFESDKIFTEKRMPATIDILRDSQADIIGLQEVSPDFLELILSADWVRENYFVSDVNPGKTVKPFGNFILSKLPFTLVEHRFFSHKRLLVGTWEINGQKLHGAVVHLTSDRGKNAPDKRRYQLTTLLNYLHIQEGTCLIMGDFNTRGDEQKNTLNNSNFADIWEVLHPGEVGYTFEPQANPLAALMSREGKPARFDRILMQGKDKHKNNWVATEINLFGCEPIANTDNLFPSDHFGVCAVLTWEEEALKRNDEPKFEDNLLSIRPVYHSAIAVIPPEDVQPAIQKIRQQFDARFERWMPHINLIYGFLPDNYFAQAVELITPELEKLSPFTVSFAEYDTFQHRSSCTAWLRPIMEPENALQELQAILAKLFPQCNEQSQKSANGFTPHLSVGQFANREEALEKLPKWHKLSFTVDAIALISRDGNQPFTVKHWIKLGKNTLISPSSTTDRELIALVNELEPTLNPQQQQQRQTVWEIIHQACSECLGMEASLHLLGSARLGIANPNSDMDLVCLIPKYLNGDAFLASVQKRLEGLCNTSQLALNAKIPVLRSQIDGVCFDLLYAGVDLQQLSDDTHLYSNLSLLLNQNLDPISRKAIIGCIEADLIKDLVTKQVPWELFCNFLRAIKAWAKSRQIYGNSWGFLGGFSWGILCAWICVNYRPTQLNLTSLLQLFFDILSQYDWQNTLALTDVCKQYQPELPKDILPIITSVSPCQNSARNITFSTAQILKTEFKRGAEITKEIVNPTQLSNQENPGFNWLNLFSPELESQALTNAQTDTQIDTLLNIEILPQSNQDIQQLTQTLEAYLIGLIIQLEQQDIFIRPYPRIIHHPQDDSTHLQINFGLRMGDNRLNALNPGINQTRRKAIEELVINFISSNVGDRNICAIRVNFSSSK